MEMGDSMTPLHLVGWDWLKALTEWAEAGERRNWQLGTSGGRVYCRLAWQHEQTRVWTVCKYATGLPEAVYLAFNQLRTDGHPTPELP